MSGIKRLIYDVDGTLINFVSFDEPITKVLKKYGIYSEENARAYTNAMLLYEKVYPSYRLNDNLYHLNNHLKGYLPMEGLQMYMEELRYCVSSPYPNLDKSLEELSQNYELVVLTNFFSNSQSSRLETLGIRKYFIDIYGERVSKPAYSSYFDAIGSHKPYDW